MAKNIMIQNGRPRQKGNTAAIAFLFIYGKNLLQIMDKGNTFAVTS